MRNSIHRFVARYISPPRVFAAMLIAAIAWLIPAVAADDIPVLSPTIFNPKTLNASADECMECAVSGPQYCSHANPDCCGHWINTCQDPPPPSYLPPSVASSIACDLWGNGSWCRQNARLTVWASDPQGFAVTVGGTSPDFSCASGCTMQLSPGQGTASYWASTAATGLSAYGSIYWAYDSEMPTIGGIAIEGTLNETGEWYTSSTRLTPMTSDNSGTTHTQYSINGQAWLNGDSVTLSDGVYAVDFLVSDPAGNSSQAFQALSVDTTPPIILITNSGTAGSNDWFVSAPTLTAVTSDNLSGVASTQYRIDGGAWSDGNSVSLSDGIYLVEFLAFDIAGNSTLVSQTVSVDTVPPLLQHSIAGVSGNSPWYVSNITVTSSAFDLISGIDTAEYRLDGGAWQAGQVISVGDGIHILNLRARDKAGNQTQYSLDLRVDTVPPLARITSHANGALVNQVVTLRGISSDDLSGVARVQIRYDDSAWTDAEHWSQNDWVDSWATSYGMNGPHTITLRVKDNAGNTSVDTIEIEVENRPPFLFAPAAPSPTGTLPPSPTPTFIPTIAPTITLPGPTAEVSVRPLRGSQAQAAAVPTSPASLSKNVPVKGLVGSWKPYLVAAGLFAAFGSSFVLDRRHRAYRKTAEILLGIMKNSSQKE